MDMTNYLFHKWQTDYKKKSIQIQNKYLYGWNIHNKLKNMHLG